MWSTDVWKKIKFQIETRVPPLFVRPITRRCCVTLPISEKYTLIVEIIVQGVHSGINFALFQDKFNITGI